MEHRVAHLFLNNCRARPRRSPINMNGIINAIPVPHVPPPAAHSGTTDPAGPGNPTIGAMTLPAGKPGKGNEMTGAGFTVSAAGLLIKTAHGLIATTSYCPASEAFVGLIVRPAVSAPKIRVPFDKGMPSFRH